LLAFTRPRIDTSECPLNPYEQALDAHISAVQAALDAIEEGKKVATTTMAEATPVQLLQRCSLFVDGLRNLCDHGVMLTPQCGTQTRVEATTTVEMVSRSIASIFGVVDTNTDPRLCTAAGAGIVSITVDTPAAFVVQTVQFDGQLRSDGGEIVEATLIQIRSGSGSSSGGGGGGDSGGGSGGGGGVRGGDRVMANVADVGDGTYACSYTATTEEGEWQLEVRVGGNHIKGSPFAIHVAASIQLVFTGAPFDTNGVLHWIGTGEGAHAYANPHGVEGGVVAAMSTIGDGLCDPSRFVDHHRIEMQNYTNSWPNSWMSVDLGPTRLLAVNHYCLRHGFSTGSYALRNWRLEASNDATTWVTLKTHTDDDSIGGTGFATADWAVTALSTGGQPITEFAIEDWHLTPPAVERFRYFRIIQFGTNSSNGGHLNCAGIELYGTIRHV
jgi:hypothetical protein